MRVNVACQQHRLKEQHARRPDRSRSPEDRQDHFADHRFAAEKEKRADKQRYGEKSQHKGSIVRELGRSVNPDFERERDCWRVVPVLKNFYMDIKTATIANLQFSMVSPCWQIKC